MNLTDAVKKVLKTKSKSIIKNFWKDDLIVIFGEVGEDILTLGRVGKNSLQSLKRQNVKVSITRILTTGQDTVTLFKVVPGRVKDGFRYFRDDFLEALDQAEDSRQKTTFIAKTLGALVSMSIPGFYQINKTKKTFTVKKIRNQNVFVQYIFFQLVFKVTQLITYRFLEALEEELTNENDLGNIRYLKGLITGGNNNYVHLQEMEKPQQGDPSFEILERFKHFIMTGER